MRICMISFSKYGYRVGNKIYDKLSQEENIEVIHAVKGIESQSYINKAHIVDLKKLDTKSFIQAHLEETSVFIFVCATGIAVRLMAPYLQNKKIDPAVLVLDDQGKFCISLVSGHLGGANEWTNKIANIVGAVPVITTSTDIHGKFAVDVFAKENLLHITDMDMAKEISATLLQGNSIGFYSEIPVDGEIDGDLICHRENLILNEKLDNQNEAKQCVTYGIAITDTSEKKPFPKTLQLIPKNLVLGIGCRRGTTADVIEQAILKYVNQKKIAIQSIAKMGSIDLKKEELGILSFSNKYQIPFDVFTKEELLHAQGSFQESSFVAGITGVGNVCERSAALLGNGQILYKKEIVDGITLAVGCVDCIVKFDTSSKIE